MAIYGKNEANYKSLQGVWFPFTKDTPLFQELMTKVKNWRKVSLDIESPNMAKNDLERFFLTAFAVIDIGLSLTSDYITYKETGPQIEKLYSLTSEQRCLTNTEYF
ncbi:hypothetical protein ACQT3V_08910 [Brucella sp. NF 2653]|uniref:hypothetical protein n=1 Tax=Brucella sp. NF 2653 TaxID=693748 RepID=UPI003D0BF4A6